MGSQTETLMVPTLDPEAIGRVKDAMLRIVEAFRNAVKQIAEILTPIIKAVAENASKWISDLLRLVATPKEWRIYKHTKKQRTREKYRKRLTRRLMAFLSEARTSGNG